MDELKENLKKANARITQLENFIKQNGLSVPASNYKKEEDEEEKRKEIEEKAKEKDTENKVEEIKKKFDPKNMGIGERINISLGLLKEDDTYDNRLEIMANLQVVKEIIESNPGMGDLNTNNIMKNAAGDNMNGKCNNNSGNNSVGSAIENNCNKFLSKIKGYEINETKNSNSLSKEELKELPSYEYIRITVQKEIQQGLLYISKNNPKNPIKFLGEFLIEKSKNYNA